MLQNQTHFLNVMNFDFVRTRAALHESVKLGVRICNIAVRLARYNSSEPNSAIVFAGEVVCAYSFPTVTVTPLIRNTRCPVRPENSIIFMWKRSSRIQLLATRYITPTLQLKLLMIWLFLCMVAGYLGHLCFVCTYKLRSYWNYGAALAVHKNDSLSILV